MCKKIKLFFTKSKLKEINGKVEGHLGLNEGILLFKIARGLKENSVIVEIGAFKGKSTCFIAEGLGGKRVNFFTIDTWRSDAMSQEPQDIYSIFLENIEPYKEIIKPLRGYSYEVVKDWPLERRIDFLWIDGDHSYEGVKQDIKDWLPLAKKNSFICFHDYRDAAGVKKATEELIADGSIKVVKAVGNVFVSKLK